MKYASKFQLIETTTYLFLSISLDEVVNKIYNMHFFDKIRIRVLTKQAMCI